MEFGKINIERNLNREVTSAEVDGFVKLFNLSFKEGNAKEYKRKLIEHYGAKVVNNRKELREFEALVFKCVDCTACECFLFCEKLSESGGEPDNNFLTVKVYAGKVFYNKKPYIINNRMRMLLSAFISYLREKNRVEE